MKKKIGKNKQVKQKMLKIPKKRVFCQLACVVNFI